MFVWHLFYAFLRTRACYFTWYCFADIVLLDNNLQYLVTNRIVKFNYSRIAIIYEWNQVWLM